MALRTLDVGRGRYPQETSAWFLPKVRLVTRPAGVGVSLTPASVSSLHIDHCQGRNVSVAWQAVFGLSSAYGPRLTVQTLLFYTRIPAPMHRPGWPGLSCLLCGLVSAHIAPCSPLE